MSQQNQLFKSNRMMYLPFIIIYRFWIHFFGCSIKNWLQFFRSCLSFSTYPLSLSLVSWPPYCLPPESLPSSSPSASTNFTSRLSLGLISLPPPPHPLYLLLFFHLGFKYLFHLKLRINFAASLMREWFYKIRYFQRENWLWVNLCWLNIFIVHCFMIWWCSFFK